jgi:putative DNA primase/helicase
MIDTTSSPTHPALALAALGMRVFPAHTVHKGRCSCNSTQCQNPGKHPRFGGWQTEATTDPAQIRRWRSTLPQANWGYAVDGAVLDVDPRNGGDESVMQLQRDHGPLPDTWRSLTGGGGEHHYFTLPEGVTVKSGPLAGYPGLDIKTVGSLVIAPGSVHASGRRYEWDGAAHPEDIPRAGAPAWLIELARRPHAVETAPASDDAPITQNRNVTLTSIAGRLRAAGLSHGAIEAALLATNEERCQPCLDDGEVLSIARSVARYPAGTLPPPPPRDPDVEELRERVRIAESVRDHNDRLAEQVRRASEALECVRLELSSTLKDPRDKLIGLATVFEMHERKKIAKYTDPELGVRITRDGVKSKCGLSKDGVTDSWDLYNKAGHNWGRQDVSRKVQDATPRGYHRETDIWVKPQETLVDDLRDLVWIELPRRKGGTRAEKPKVWCSVCKGYHVTRKQYNECQGCGNTWDDNSYDINQRNQEQAEKARVSEEQSRERLIASPVNTLNKGRLIASRGISTESEPTTAPAPAPAVPQKQRTLPPPGDGITEFDPHEWPTHIPIGAG